MTQQWTPQWVDQSAAPVIPPKKNTGLKVLGVGLISLSFFFLGTSVGKTAPVAAVPSPAAVTVTATTTTITTLTPKSVIPRDCILALDEADKLIVIFQDTMYIVSNTFDAVSRGDVKTINTNVTKMNAQTAKINENKYVINSVACRAQG